MRANPQTPMRNDDALEKSIRRQTAARPDLSIAGTARRIQASPLARSNNYSRSSSASAENVNAAEFQEWMKMVRTKRVKANNAFAIRLIDAFHGMVRGDILGQDQALGTDADAAVSFQEASHTLGGCVTVYRSRVAKVKDDTAKLLEEFSRGSNGANNDEGASDSENDDESESENSHTRKSRARKRPARVLGDERSCLAPPEKLQIDTHELATTIDPLLRKMAADFDKRGAAALLDFVLKIGPDGRLYLGAESSQNSVAKPDEENSPVAENRLESIDEIDEEMQAAETQNSPSMSPLHESTLPLVDLARINITSFGSSYTHRDSLPLVSSISRAVSDPQKTDQFMSNMRAWAMADPGSTSTYDERVNDDIGGIDFEADELGGENEDARSDGLGIDLGGDFDLGGGDIEFDDPAGDPSEPENMSLNSMISNRMPVSGQWMDVGRLQSLETSGWGGLSSWKAQNKKLYRERKAQEAAQVDSRTGRRERANAPSFLDFSADEVDIDALNRGTKSTTLRTHAVEDVHILPREFHVNARSLTALSLRPKTGLARAFRHGIWRQPNQRSALRSLGPDVDGTGNMTLDFTGDGGDAADFSGNADDYFHAGWEVERPTTAAELFPQKSGLGGASNQLNYARAAKRIDLRRLKENVWKAIHAEDMNNEGVHSHEIQNHRNVDNNANSDPNQEEARHLPEYEERDHSPHSLLQIIRETQPLYTEQERSDLSPALYFVSLLHLSNEHGLALQNTESLTDVIINEEVAS